MSFSGIPLYVFTYILVTKALDFFESEVVGQKAFLQHVNTVLPDHFPIA
jgi:hypothetical protein